MYLEEESSVIGNVLPCAGGESTVEVTFISEGVIFTLAEYLFTMITETL